MDGQEHELKLGNSFAKNSSVAFHSIRYDFKPASVDSSQMSTLEIDQDKSVSVTVPHVEGSGTKQTVFKGSKKALQKECILIIDHNTGEVRLEKLSSHIQVKKTRQEGTSRAQNVSRPVTPAEQSKGKDCVSSTSKQPEEPQPSRNTPSPFTRVSQDIEAVKESLGLTLSDSSSDDDDDDEVDSSSIPIPFSKPNSTVIPFHREESEIVLRSPAAPETLINKDLNLSDSDSDSD